MSRRLDSLICADCRVDTSFDCLGHYYTARKEVWREATGGQPIRFLCFDCLEVRLGRRVTEADLIATPPEIIARLNGRDGTPKPPAERQHELQDWRAFAWRRFRAACVEQPRESSGPYQRHLRLRQRRQARDAESTD